AAPAVVGPREGARVDDLGGAVDALGLEPRGGVGERVAAIETVAVARAGAGLGGDAAEVAVAFGLQHHRGGLVAPGGLEDDLDAAPLRRPDAEVDAALRAHMRADGKAGGWRGGGHGGAGEGRERGERPAAT